MAEEETGFTFVDKRNAQTDTGVPTEVEDPVADPALSDEETKTSPDVYEVIGYCISLLATEAWHKLGLLADPKTGEAVADLAQAKAAVDAAGDLAARLEAAPQEAVPEALRRDLRTLINDLRLNYVSQRGDNATSRN